MPIRTFRFYPTFWCSDNKIIHVLKPDLLPGEKYCNICDGFGYFDQTSTFLYGIKLSSYKCTKCNGNGTLPWWEEIIRVYNYLYTGSLIKICSTPSIQSNRFFKIYKNRKSKL